MAATRNSVVKTSQEEAARDDTQRIPPEVLIVSRARFQNRSRSLAPPNETAKEAGVRVSKCSLRRRHLAQQRIPISSILRTVLEGEGHSRRYLRSWDRAGGSRGYGNGLLCHLGKLRHSGRYGNPLKRRKAKQHPQFFAGTEHARGSEAN
mmetsp:Transcript_16344/g.35370  ORF Transcript_16344/g.35370 Transcript_16344/m.35370 type:complete len:150 (+) Transcript_16344:120-569(+)